MRTIVFYASATLAASLPFCVLAALHLVFEAPPVVPPEHWRFLHLALLNTAVLGVLTAAFKAHSRRRPDPILWFWLVLDLVMVFGAAHVLVDLLGNADPFAWENWYDLIFVLEVAFDLVDLIDVLFFKVRRGQLSFWSCDVLVFCLLHHTFAIVGTVIACQLRVLPRFLAFFTFNILSHVFVVIGRLIRIAVDADGGRNVLLWRAYRIFQLVANVFLRIVLTAWAAYDLLHHQLEAVVLRFGAGRSLRLSVTSLLAVFLIYNINLVFTYARILQRDWSRGIEAKVEEKKKDA